MTIQNHGDSQDSGSDDRERPRHVIFTLDEDLKPGHILGVAQGFEEIGEVSKKWWKAFESGEKEKPKNYRGISNRPVADFDRWSEGDRDA